MPHEWRRCMKPSSSDSITPASSPSGLFHLPKASAQGRPSSAGTPRGDTAPAGDGRYFQDCPHCGSPLHGDGYKTVLHCENADLEKVWETEPDASPVLCGEATK